MERLTVKRPDGRWAIASSDNASPTERVMKIPAVIDRLAAYEDTGLEPEGIKTLQHCYAQRGKMLDELMSKYGLYHDGMGDAILNLLQAQKEGRLVVLPVKPGTKVYTTRWWDDVPEICLDSRGKKFRRLTQRHKVTKEEFLPFSLDYTQFGKEVFLTREEAEKALKGGSSDEP